jgi:hypothetical protein
MSDTIATPRRVAVGLSAVGLAAALALTGCSSSQVKTTGANTPAAGPSSSAAAGAASTPTTAGASSTAASTSSGGGAVSLGGGSFCSVAKKVQAEQASSAAAATDSPDSLKALLIQANQELQAFVAIAPSAIKGDVQTLATAEKSFFTAIQAANYDVTKVSPSALTDLDTPAVTTATDHITAYLASQCGIVEPTDGSS